MNIKLLFYLSTFLLYNNLIYSQCGLCNNPGGVITNNGNNFFTATTAQEYFWEICSGNANISGSNTGQTVAVNATGTYTIKVVQFNNGNCTEACEFVNYDPCETTAPCFSNQNFSWWRSTDCRETTVTLYYALGQPQCVDYVDWYWEVCDIPDCRNNESLGDNLSVVITHKPYEVPIDVCADVVLENGTTCSRICRTINPSCDGPGPGN